jgi:hypothetical protein
MREKLNLRMIYHRTLFGLAEALGCVGPATILTLSEIEAQTARMERREGRRDRPETRRKGPQDYGNSGSSKCIRQIRRRPAA